ncbi:MAG: phenylalanine--tRNA ligase subunit beta [Fimbriimonas sp.]|nr:phenylalanine--tRNA ligase subunit beta [Fimbriimonas sp.]
MKFPFSMLLDYVSTALDAAEVGDLLTMAGFELEGIDLVEGHSVLDIKVMSNRGDGLSVFGLAREVLARDPAASPTGLYHRAAGRFKDCEMGTEIAETDVSIETPACGRYACVLLKGVANGDSMPWVQDRLVKAGMRPISLLVDVTNYVMLELGQPLHAFDFDRLVGGRIVVREASPGEQISTLNGIEHQLEAGQMMICDAERPVAVAGVMGGGETEVDADTSNVLLESAHFSSMSVRKTRKQLGLNTEASYRFERSVDPDGVVAALHRCVELIREGCAGVVGTSVVDRYPGKSERSPLELRVDRVCRMLGMKVTTDEVRGYLTRLGFEVHATEEGVLAVTPPSWRPDVVREIDLIEEVGRVHGYDRIPEMLLDGVTKMGGPQGFELWTDWLRQAVLRAGLTQTISHSMRDLHPLDEAESNRIGPRIPASPDTGYLRNSLLPSLADAVRRNNPKESHLFELGRVFCGQHGEYLETLRLAAMVAGPIVPAGWSHAELGSSSFFTVKGLLESAMEAVGVSLRFEAKCLDKRLHPTRQARVWAGDKSIGVIGQLHPDSAQHCGLPVETVVFEILVRDAFDSRDSALRLKPVSRHPAVRRDISVLADQSVAYETVSQVIAGAVGTVLERQWLFDEFVGQGIPDGKRALGIALQFRKPDSTFTDEEANLVRDRAVAALAEIGATTR